MTEPDLAPLLAYLREAALVFARRVPGQRNDEIAFIPLVDAALEALDLKVLGDDKHLREVAALLLTAMRVQHLTTKEVMSSGPSARRGGERC
jgi:hypothetical protein